jgi:hypothetical protein
MQNRYKEMLASTIQFSKYGQEHRTRSTTCQARTPPQGNNTPRTRHPHQRFGESRPQPPHPTNLHRLSSDPEETEPTPKTLRSSEPGPIPQDPTARLDDPLGPLRVPHPPEAGSTNIGSSAAHLMVNVPHSEAPSPQDIRLGNDE